MDLELETGSTERATPSAPLEGFRFLELGDDPAAAYAGRLLVQLGAQVDKHSGAGPSGTADAPRGWLDVGKVDVTGTGPLLSSRRGWDGVLGVRGIDIARMPAPTVRVEPTRSPAADWAGSGAMALSASPEDEYLLAPGLLATAMRGAAAAFELLAACWGVTSPLDGPALLGERAALVGLRGRRGSVSASGSARILAAADGWLAVTLARESDLDLVPAWLEAGPVEWDELASAVARHPVGWLVERAQLLGLPVAEVGPPSGGTDIQLEARGQSWPPAPWLLDGLAPAAWGTHTSGADPTAPLRAGPSRARVVRRAPLVVDLSALWAGPLASSLLVAAGCRVVKVEDPARPDTTRTWSPTFFDLLNGGKFSVALPFGPRGPLAELLAAADVVLESSRPRAMEQLGIAPRSGQLWVSITGYGRTGPWRQRVALGDDAAAAGGLVARGSRTQRPFFCGDAAADPVTGLHAAVALLAGIVAGATGTVDLAMREVVGHAVGPVQWPSDGRLPGRSELAPVVPPRARPVREAGPPLGRDTASVLGAL